MDKQTEKNLLALVQRNYEEIAVDFDKSRKKELWPEIIKLAEQVKNGDRVLDAGCGNGRLLRAFDGKQISYLAVDNSQELVEAAKKNFKFSNKLNSYKFILGDVLELDKLPEKDFDYVFCLAVLHHLPGDEPRLKALKQMRNKLKANGKIILTVWNLWPQAKFRNLIFKYGLLKLIGKNKMDFGDILFAWKNNQGEPVSRRYYHAFTGHELKKLAVFASLKIEKLYKDKYNYYLVLRK